jgi:hypothetical protein
MVNAEHSMIMKNPFIPSIRVLLYARECLVKNCIYVSCMSVV